MSRPEDSLAADIYYNDMEARKYTTSSRIQTIQASMTRRALQLLDLRCPSLILDVGCGSGLSGEILSSPSSSSTTSTTGGPHTWIGMDLSPSMLDVALERDVAGDLLLADMGQGVPFRAGTFDAAISISAIQWLCSEESSSSSSDPFSSSSSSSSSSTTTSAARLARFFDGLYAALRRGARAVCQFYPRNDAQRTLITRAAIRAGFSAGILEDNPGSKNVKLYLVLGVGGGGLDGQQRGIMDLVGGMDNVDIIQQQQQQHQSHGTTTGDAAAAARRKGLPPKKGSKAWIIRKKEQMERQGKIVKATSKYTGRKRRIAF